MADPFPPAPEPQPPGAVGIPVSDMPMYDKTLAEARSTGSVGISALPHKPTMTEMLQQKRNFLAAQLADVDAALEQMRIQKDAAALIDAITKASPRQEY